MNDKLEVLRANYIRSLTSAKEELQLLVELLGQDGTVVEQLRQLAHKLAGSGATYGFESVSKAAKQLEHACCKGASNEESPKISALRLIDVIHNTKYDAPSAIELGAIKESCESSPFDVLIIEDDAHQAELLQALLKDGGANAEIAESVPQAHLKLSLQSYDFIICDLDLQGNRLSGAEYLRAMPVNDAMVIVVTSHADFNARLAAVRAGAQAFIEKPFTAKELNAVFTRFVHDKSIENKTVLVVEDDVAQSQLYTEVIKTLGVNVIETRDPRTAYDILTQRHVDLVITDVHLPICSGIEFGRLLRHNWKLNHVPILFMSTDTSIDTKLSALEVAAEEFVSKPIEPWRLAVIVESRLRNLPLRE